MTKKPYPSDKLDQYIVRFPDGMRDRLKAAAEANKRSMNAEIIARLEDSFSDFGRDAWRARADKQDERLDNLEAFLRSNGKVPLIED